MKNTLLIHAIENNNFNEARMQTIYECIKSIDKLESMFNNCNNFVSMQQNKRQVKMFNNSKMNFINKLQGK